MLWDTLMWVSPWEKGRQVPPIATGQFQPHQSSPSCLCYIQCLLRAMAPQSKWGDTDTPLSGVHTVLVLTQWELGRSAGTRFILKTTLCLSKNAVATPHRSLPKRVAQLGLGLASGPLTTLCPLT